jgi:hypothetical protein
MSIFNDISGVNINVIKDDTKNAILMSLKVSIFNDIFGVNINVIKGVNI